MSDLGHPSRPLRSYRGDVRRSEVRKVGGLPREGEVVVHELRYSDGWHLEVEASWRGVPVGAPPVPADVRPGIAHDQVDVGRDVELARAVAEALAEALRAGRIVDAQHELARARRRRMGGAQKIGETR